MCTWYHHLPVSHVASASRQSDPHYCFCYRTELRRRERGASYAWSHSIVSSSAFSGWRSRCWNLCAQQNRSDVAHQAPPTREYLPIQRYALPRKVSTSMDSPKSSPNAAGGRRQRPRGRGTGRPDGPRRGATRCRVRFRWTVWQKRRPEARSRPFRGSDGRPQASSRRVAVPSVVLVTGLSG